MSGQITAVVVAVSVLFLLPVFLAVEHGVDESSCPKPMANSNVNNITVLAPPGPKGDAGPPGPRGIRGEGRDGTSREARTTRAGGTEGCGAVYVRWGQTSCEEGTGTVTVYSGLAGGAWYNHKGGGSNYQCLPSDPEWGWYKDGLQKTGEAYMYGAEFQIGLDSPYDMGAIHDRNVPCAVCHSLSRRAQLMIPARKTCPEGWTREYGGYLMTGHNTYFRTEFVCMDGEPEVLPGGERNEDGALFYIVEARCGSLPCPPYVEGRELTCVVCTK
ncbi:hypothetical protein Bbelb_280370 [Branchiostoma belcheri]|nr:hypothetical protein Bbelb_280370 [Branchiostoma belcheri]